MGAHRSKGEWDKLIGEYRSSGQSRAKFCEGRGLKESTLEYHLSKRRKNKFVEVTAAPAVSGNHSATLELPGGAVFRLKW